MSFYQYMQRKETCDTGKNEIRKSNKYLRCVLTIEQLYDKISVKKMLGGDCDGIERITVHRTEVGDSCGKR